MRQDLDWFFHRTGGRHSSKEDKGEDIGWGGVGTGAAALEIE